MPRPRQIVAIGGGGFSSEPDNPLLDDFILELAGVDRPRICFLPTASSNVATSIVSFYAAYARKADASHLDLYARPADVRTPLLQQDVVYVGGGNTANLLAVWRTQEVDRILREAWERGTVLAGISAGGLCWFSGGVTDSFGLQLEALADGLGFLEGSFCPHYDGEALRKPRYGELVASGTLPAGYAVDDGAALVFDGQDLREVVASRPSAGAYRVEVVDDKVVERPLPVRRLGADR